MNEYINVYMGEVTKGGKDGDLVSQNNLQTSPISVSLDATQNEVKYIKCAIRTEPGYTSSRTAISFLGLTQEKWLIAKDNDVKDEKEAEEKGDFEKQLIITDTVDSTNKIIWLRVSSANDEKPQRDISVTIKIDTYIITA